MRAMGRLLSTTPPLLLSALIATQPLAARAPSDAAVEARLRGHVETLAADAMEGRKPGTEGGNMAAAYIARAFAAVGLKAGATDGSYYMPVALVERRPADTKAEWRISGAVVRVDADTVALRAAAPETRIMDAPLIFGGYGIDDEKAGIRSFDGVDVRGAVVLIFGDTPPGLDHAPGYTARRDALIASGAAAVIRIAPDDKKWADFDKALAEPENDLADGTPEPTRGAMAPAAWAKLAKAGKLDGITAADMARPEFRAVRIDGTASLNIATSLRPYRSWNVVGRLAGSDPAAGALLYLAHWDHLGICRPEGAADRICNGAVDNASGVAMIIEVARGLAAAKKPPVRDIYFVATTAEEMGLLGAHALAKAPPVPAERIAAVLNFDTVAIAPRATPVATLGRGQTPLDPLIDAAARRQGRRINASTDANALTPRQDGWAFTQIGVPAVMVGGSLNLDLLKAYLGGEYHKPGDDLAQPIVLDGVAEDVRLHVTLGQMIADPKRYQPPPR
ncbi:Zn-dependent amino- or carboxypeptidase, M28 family [Sphingomonas laterariae]|uniref:Zn-dependent amino- or carboxypeptidase, M28 family n=2 Tax=Edaphosphingomonas laterariae TaxID=861865 RepID=A0A239DBP9_9SPHN|nr:Zn-dependent amino- or carboxypeptidase, M28 family [Sphingomonas laterariae]